MSEPRPLPELTEAVLDDDTLAALVRDLRGETQLLEVQLKGGQFERGQRHQIPLEQAVSMLTAGEIRGVQIRYRWSEQEWLDTLLRHPEGIKLVRIQVE